MSEELTPTPEVPVNESQAITEDPKAEEARLSRVIQIVQSDKTGKIDIFPLQNLKFRSDIIGILVQSLNNLQNEDIAKSNASLLRETISIIKDNEPKA